MLDMLTNPLFLLAHKYIAIKKAILKTSMAVQFDKSIVINLT